MKQKLVFVSSLLLLAAGAFAQKEAIIHHPAVWGIHLNTLDIKTPQVLKDKCTEDTGWFQRSQLWFSLSYWRTRLLISTCQEKITGMFHDYAGDDRNESTLKQIWR